jgi:hypothetical protein
MLPYSLRISATGVESTRWTSPEVMLLNESHIPAGAPSRQHRVWRELQIEILFLQQPVHQAN